MNSKNKYGRARKTLMDDQDRQGYNECYKQHYQKKRGMAKVRRRRGTMKEGYEKVE